MTPRAAATVHGSRMAPPTRLVRAWRRTPHRRQAPRPAPRPRPESREPAAVSPSARTPRPATPSVGSLSSRMRRARFSAADFWGSGAARGTSILRCLTRPTTRSPPSDPSSGGMDTRKFPASSCTSERSLVSKVFRGREPWSWWEEAADGGRLVVGAEVGGDATEGSSKGRRGRAPVVVGGLPFVVGLRSSTGEVSQTYGPGWGLIGEEFFKRNINSIFGYYSYRESRRSVPNGTRCSSIG